MEHVERNGKHLEPGWQTFDSVHMEHHRELLNFQLGETDLVYRDKEWFVFTTVDVPDQKEREAIEWMGVDMGIVSIAETSDGARWNGRRFSLHRCA